MSVVFGPRYVVGFSGHRSGYDEEVIRPALIRALEGLRERVEGIGGTLELCASVAEGSDTLFVEVARGLGLPVHVLLPLPEGEFEKDFSSPESWERTRRQIGLVRECPERDSLRVTAGTMERPDCYYDQGVEMLESVDVLVSLWDGREARGLGGTAQMLELAEGLGLPRIIVDSATGKVTENGDFAEFLVRDPVLEELGLGAGTGDAREGEEDADALQQHLDVEAMREAGAFRPSLRRIILLHGGAALLAASVTLKLATGSPWESWKWAITAAELLMVSQALRLVFLLHRRRHQQRWILFRFAAELVRGMRASVPLLDPLRPGCACHGREWRRFAVSVGLLLRSRCAALGPIELRNEYIRLRFDDASDGQLTHYRKKSVEAHPWWRFTGMVAAWSAILAPPFVLFSLLNKLSAVVSIGGGGWHLEQSATGWLLVVFFPIALPLLAGVAASLRQAADANRRTRRYPEMAKFLEKSRDELSRLESRASIARCVGRIEEILLDELREWELTARGTDHG